MPDADVLVVGGGHNGLVAAILAALAGRQVTLLERSVRLGGATVSEALFDGHPALLSRYSYLISLFPQALVHRLGIELPLASRSVSSYTPTWRDGRPSGLLVERPAGAASRNSFREVTGGDADYAALQTWNADLAALAAVVAPVLLGPLQHRDRIRAGVLEALGADRGAQLWSDLFEHPIGEAICRRFGDDLVRGVIATDALIGTFTSLFAPTLLANKCLLYHVIGRGTGEWLVPVGGMGALTAQLVRRAEALGVQLQCGTEVSAAAANDAGVNVATSSAAGEQEWHVRKVLAAVAPATVEGWLGRPVERPIGSQVKVNLLLKRLPRLASGADPAVAFAGTMHLEEGFEQLEAAYRAAASGVVPNSLPAEVYCHSLTDPSILQGSGGATLTLFGLHAPVDLFDADPLAARESARTAALGSLQRHLAEPLEDCIAVDSAGRPCAEVASPRDLVESLGMPGGHIFHQDLSWPWLDDAEVAETAADRYGVGVRGTQHILLAGAGSRRGGGVSGLGGAAAVDAMLADAS